MNSTPTGSNARAHYEDIPRDHPVAWSDAPTSSDAPPLPKPIELLTIEDVLAMDPPPWIIRRYLRQGECMILHGAPACGKSFIAISMAMAVAGGNAWFGQRVTGGNVVYVCGEGVAGFRTRLLAATHPDTPHKIHPLADRLRVVPRAVALVNSPDIRLLIREIVEQHPEPCLVVLDTLARCFVGGDENSAQDMGLAVAAVDRIREELGAAVLLVHHDTKDGRSERGSSVLRGAADVMIAARKERESRVEVVSLTVGKIKDGAPPPELRLGLEIVDLGPDPEEPSEKITSCVLVPHVPRLSDSLVSFDNASKRILDAFDRCFDAEDPPNGEKLQVSSGVAKTTFYARLKALQSSEEIVRIKKGRGHVYLLPGWVDDYQRSRATPDHQQTDSETATVEKPPATADLDAENKKPDQ